MVTFRSDFDVELIDKMGSDVKVAAAARNSVSMKSALKLYEESDEESKSVRGLLKSLMHKRHGVPFEHCLMTISFDQPIFNWREHMRHRIASYSEASARYRPLRPIFYIPPRERKLSKILNFNPMSPVFEEMEAQDYEVFIADMKSAYEAQWRIYQSLMERDVDPGIPRGVIGTGVYSTAWVTWNLRSIMNFLSLRVHDLRARDVSYPQWEINQVALQVERIFEQEFPRTYEYFIEVGRRAP